VSHFRYKDRADGKGDDQIKQTLVQLGKGISRPSTWRNGDALCRVDLREAAMGFGTRRRLRAIGNIDNRRKRRNPRTALGISPESSGGGR
jgi:hypothetical protein